VEGFLLAKMIANLPNRKEQYSVGGQGIQKIGDPMIMTHRLLLISVRILQAFDKIALAADKYL
jgi:hypothetical protein